MPNTICSGHVILDISRGSAVDALREAGAAAGEAALVQRAVRPVAHGEDGGVIPRAGADVAAGLVLAAQRGLVVRDHEPVDNDTAGMQPRRQRYLEKNATQMP